MCFDNIIKIERSFPDKAVWNNFVMQLQSDLLLHASSFNKCFFLNSPWHCALFTKKNAPINPLTRSGVPLKINYPLVLYAGSFWYLYKDANELFKPNASKRTFFHSICPDDRLKSVDCVKANLHLYTVSSVDKIAAVIVISIIFFAFDATRHSHSAKSSVSR